MPEFDSERFRFERLAMVRETIEARGVRAPAVLAAMRAVPREDFVPDDLRAEAYADMPLPIGGGQTISQPYIVAAMTAWLAPAPGHAVLEIGAGSGYQAAVLARLARQVYTVEIRADLAAAAQARLARLGVGNVAMRVGDGRAGWPEHTPYDGILVTAAPASIPPALADQLKPGGRMVIPIGPAYEVQELMGFEKTRDGRLRGQELMAVRFVPLL